MKEWKVNTDKMRKMTRNQKGRKMKKRRRGWSEDEYRRVEKWMRKGITEREDWTDKGRDEGN